ncbi:MAG TPA: hypothetical protein PLG79_04760 [Spirochaetales bacterium]|nr:hypothetical protein [Spirochaetales bacterium]
MDIDSLFKGKPEEGFLVRITPAPDLPAEQRVTLIRKGDALFNEGNIDLAKRIFITVRYGDGLIRIGDYHLKRNEFLEAFRMYWAANEKVKSEKLIEKMAAVIREWISVGGT